MLKVRQVRAGIDGSFGMAAIAEDLPPTCTCPNGLTPVQLLGPNITARVARRRASANEWHRAWNDGCRPSGCSGHRGTPVWLAMMHVPDGVAEYTHPVRSGQGPNENVIALGTEGRLGIGTPVVC